MKICFIVNSFPSNNETKANGIFNFRAVKQLQTAHIVQVVHLKSWRPFRKFRTNLSYDGISITQISLPFYDFIHPKITNFLMMAYKRLSIALLSEKLKDIDIIHSVGASLAGVISSKISEKLNIPHVAQCNGTDVNIDLYRMHKYSAYRNWEKQVSCFICNSRALENTLHQIYPNIKNSTTVYRGVDLSNFSFSKINTTKNKTHFLFLGGLSVRKGMNYGRNFKGGVDVLKAAISVLKKGYEQEAFFIFGGPNATISEIQDGIGKEINDYKNNFRFIGKISPDEVIVQMESSDVIIVASLMEGLPNIAMEAMAIGRPVIGSKAGGIPEILEHKRNGLLYEAGNIKQLAASIEHYLIYRNDILQHSEHARKTVEEGFDRKNLIPSYTRIYKKLLSEKRHF